MTRITHLALTPFTFAPDAEMRAARRNGWGWPDLTWERWTETGNAALIAGHEHVAIPNFRRAFMLARLFWGRSDPRYATSLANAGYADQISGRPRKGQKRYRQAQQLFGKIADDIDKIEIKSRGRSSAFHMRMEAKHWDTYCAHLRGHLRKTIAESHLALKALAAGVEPQTKLYSKWAGEKPVVFDDTRKILAAALLLAGENNTVGHEPGTSIQGDY